MCRAKAATSIRLLAQLGNEVSQIKDLKTIRYIESNMSHLKICLISQCRGTLQKKALCKSASTSRLARKGANLPDMAWAFTLFVTE